MKRISVEIENDLHKQFKLCCINEGLKMRFVILELIKKWIEENKK